MKKLIIGLISVFFFIACKKEEVSTYNDAAGVSFYISGDGTQTDSLSYSFALRLEPKIKDTVFLNMRVVGAAADHPREVKVKAGSGTTARAGIDYELPIGILPAGALTLKYPVVLINSPELKDTTLRLVVDIMDSKDLITGATGIEIGGTISLNSFIINYNNFISKPSYWSEIESWFGPFSRVKYQFMIEVLGMTDFSPYYLGGPLQYSDLLNYPVTLRNALAVYEKEHGPLMDENGNRVTF